MVLLVYGKFSDSACAPVLYRVPSKQPTRLTSCQATNSIPKKNQKHERARKYVVQLVAACSRWRCTVLGRSMRSLSAPIKSMTDAADARRVFMFPLKTPKPIPHWIGNKGTDSPHRNPWQSPGGLSCGGNWTPFTRPDEMMTASSI